MYQQAERRRVKPSLGQIMLLALILILNFSSPLSEENAVGVRFPSHTEYKIRNAFSF